MVRDPKRRKQITLLSLVTAAFATILSISMIRIAAPYIQEEFLLRYSELTWIHNSYQIAYAILLPVMGQVGDRLGRRTFLLLGLSVFALGSFLCGISWDLLSLSAFRVVQGMGASAIFTNALVLATQTYPSQERGRIMGIWAMGVSLGSVAGPSIAGFIIQVSSWRFVFFVKIIFLLFSLVTILSQVRHEVRPKPVTTPFDYTGTIILAVMLTTFVTGTVTGAETGWLNRNVILLLAVALSLGPVFFRIEAKKEAPIVDPSLFRNRMFIAGVLCGGMHLVVIQGINFLMPLFLARVHEVSALSVGLLMLPQAAVRFVISPISGIMADRYGNQLPVMLGIIVRTISLGTMAFFTPETSLVLIGFALMMDGTGAALIWAPSLNAALSSYPDEKAGSVTGIFNMLRFVMAIGGTVLVGVILETAFVSIPSVGPVPGFFHAYLTLTVLTLLTMTRVRDLRQLPDPNSLHNHH